VTYRWFDCPRNASCGCADAGRPCQVLAPPRSSRAAVFAVGLGRWVWARARLRPVCAYWHRGGCSTWAPGRMGVANGTRACTSHTDRALGMSEWGPG